MKVMSKLLIFLLLASCCVAHVDAKKKRKQYFNQTEFEIDFNITHPILTANFAGNAELEIFIMGENSNKEKIAVLYVVDKDTNQYVQHTKLVLPNTTIAFDLITTPSGLEKVLLLDAKGFSTLNFEQNSMTLLAENKSLYLNEKPQFIAKKELITDINGDGLDDIVISDFSSVKIFLQQDNGEFNKLSLPIKPNMDMDSQKISFSEAHLFNVDTNFDQLVDIVVIEDNYLQIFEQQKSGDFSLIKNQILLPMQVSSLPWWSIKGSDGESIDQSNLQHRMVESLQDINGDKIADLMVRQTESSGVLDRQNRYEIYFGTNTKGHLSFNQQMDTFVSAEGTLSGLELIDINGDGRSEILVSSFDIGISQIIGALLSGSIDQDVYIFSLDENDKYNKEPLFSEDVDLNFSLSSGRTGQPVILSADLNGDGIKELLLSANDKRLAVYTGKNGSEMFESRSKRHRLVLPQNGSMLSSADLNNDDKQEIIVRYGKQDEENLRKKVVILSAK